MRALVESLIEGLVLGCLAGHGVGGVGLAVIIEIVSHPVSEG